MKMLVASTPLIPVLITLAIVVYADEEFTDPSHLKGLAHTVHKRAPPTDGAKNQELRVVTIHQIPYTITKSKPDGTMEYSGFIPDLMLRLSRRLGFTYKFYTSKNITFGQYDNQTREWSGMIGEVIKRNNSIAVGADIAAAAITITVAREKVVNFVKPFQHLGISVVVKRPDYAKELTEYPFSFSIFQPFEPSVWALIFLSLIVVGLFLWIMNLYNPYEWAGRYGIGQADKHHSELFNLAGSIWFAFTSLQWQGMLGENEEETYGFEKSPRSIASKFLGCIWFAFVTIVLVSYTAGIVNHLFWASTVHRTIPTRAPFIDLEHLISNKDYKYGTINNSQTYKYITEVAAGEEFQVMRRFWQTPEGQAQLVPNVSAGLEKVRKEKYAFIMESMMAKYHINKRPCDLTTVGEQFGMRSYGLALPVDSPILEEMHAGILEMIEEGDMDELERRWFVDSGECWNVTFLERIVADVSSQLSVNRPKSIDMSMFWGPMVLLIVGIIAGLGIALAEMMYYRQWGRYKSSNQPQGQQLKMDPDEGNI